MLSPSLPPPRSLLPSLPLAPLRILVHDYVGHPFQVQLSRELAGRGHTVLHLYCSSFVTPHGELERRAHDPNTFQTDSISLDRQVSKYSPLQRWVQDRDYGRRLVTRVRIFEPQLVISANTPLSAQNILQRHAQREGVPFVYWLQDLYAAAAARVLRRKLPVLATIGGQLLGRLENRLFEQSDAIVAITADFLPRLPATAAVKTHTIPNWAPIVDLPIRPKVNQWSIALGLDDRFCYMYTGTLGFKHNPELLLELARRTSADSSARVVVISEGIGADWLRKKAANASLTNLTILGYQPFSAMPDVLAAADVLLGVLEEEAGVFSVPSKVLTYLCASRPILLSVPATNLSARTIREAGAGVTVPPGDIDGFVNAAMRLRSDVGARESCGANARKYAETHFQIESIASRFEAIFREVLS
jgi:colanic acid biosynthesis glycosyl transferase WcaI